MGGTPGRVVHASPLPALGSPVTFVITVSSEWIIRMPQAVWRRVRRPMQIDDWQVFGQPLDMTRIFTRCQQ